MKVYYIDKRVQDENTENPQLIDGEVLHWEVHRDFLRNVNLRQWINYLSYFRPDIKTLLIYDVISRDRYFCTHSECQEVGSGCKSKYVPNNHAITVVCAKIIDESKTAERKAINDAYTQEEWEIKYQEVINRE